MQSLSAPIYQVAQIQTLEKLALATTNGDGSVLMHRAATVISKYIRQYKPQPQHIRVFCGLGNNAGDGYLVASLLLQAKFRVTVYSIAPIAKLTGIALQAYKTYRKHAGKLSNLNKINFGKSDLILDAMFGIGLNRELSQPYINAIRIINQSQCPVISIDIPSGIDANTGAIKTQAVKATVTITLIGLKLGLFTHAAVDYCGTILLNDLNIPAKVFQQITPKTYISQPTLLPARKRNSHKGHYGHVLIIGGDLGFAGAPRLAAETALRTGAGLVSIATRATHAHNLTANCFELMAHGIKNSAELQKLINQASVIVLGTGLGQNTWGKMLFNTAIKSQIPIIIDADGLNLLAQQPMHNSNRVLTPHPKEAARLLNCPTVTVNNDRLQASTKIQQQYGGICVLKGAGSLVKSEHNCNLNTTSNPGMATAGMGDVLTGIIASLIAQGLSLSEAATTGVYLHGQAADLAVEKAGQRGLLATDLIPYLRKLVN